MRPRPHPVLPIEAPSAGPLNIIWVRLAGRGSSCQLRQGEAGGVLAAWRPDPLALQDFNVRAVTSDL